MSRGLSRTTLVEGNPHCSRIEQTQRIAFESLSYSSLQMPLLPSFFFRFFCSPKLYALSSAMLIKVKTVTNRDLELTTIEPSNTVAQLKEAIEASEGIPVIQQRLIFNGKPLVDEMTVEASGITAGVIVHMVLALRA